ncbi:MAG: hypothetical protein M3271_03000 [Actinomycetota bacterium]|nr:hypothetical protein [Actinomycetota bacterium]
MRTKRAAILLTSIVIGGSLIVATAPPAAAQPDIPCEALFRPPYDYPCHVAEGAVVFVIETVRGLGPFVEEVGDDVDEIADNTYHTVSCTVNPDDPECQ